MIYTSPWNSIEIHRIVNRRTEIGGIRLQARAQKGGCGMSSITGRGTIREANFHNGAQIRGDMGGRRARLAEFVGAHYSSRKRPRKYGFPREVDLFVRFGRR